MTYFKEGAVSSPVDPGSISELECALLAEGAPIAGRLKSTIALAKRVVFSIYSPTPQLFPVDNEFYTGRIIDSRGRWISTLPSQHHPLGTYLPSTLFFKLSPSEASDYNNKIATGTLDSADLKQLAASPREESSDFFPDINSKSYHEYLEFTMTYLSDFWDGRQTIANDRAHEYYRLKLLELAVLNNVGYVRFHEIQGRVASQMCQLGVTVYPLGGNMYQLDALLLNGKRHPRIVPIPEDCVNLFQRYLHKGEQPLTIDEIEILYKQHIDPNTSLFSRNAFHRSAPPRETEI